MVKAYRGVPARRRIRSRTVQAFAAISAATAFASCLSSARGDTYGNIYETDGGITDLNSSSAWTDESSSTTDSPPPGASDIAQFDSNTGLTSTTTFALGGETSWLGVSVLNPGAAVVIGNDGNTLTLGAGGINLGSASQNLTINDPVIISEPQTWSVGGGSSPILDVPSFTPTPGTTVEFNGPATINGSGNVPATGEIETSVGSAGTILSASSTFGGFAGEFATVGLYDWAAMDPTDSFIVGGSQISHFYTDASGAYQNFTGTQNIDITGNITTSHQIRVASIRFNTPAATTMSDSEAIATGGVLVTPAMGTNDVTISGTGSIVPLTEPSVSSTELIVWQNNTQGLLTIGTPIVSRADISSDYAQAGPGTVALSANNTYDGNTWLEGGFTEISDGNALGSSNGTLNLSGGAVVASTSTSLDNETPRAVALTASGGTLAAADGATLIVDGTITGSAPLNIGTGLVPGSGSTDGSGTVVLSAANTYTGPTNVDDGILQIDSTTGSTGTGSLAVNAGATLLGTGTLTNAVTVKSGGDLTLHDSTGSTGTITISSLTLNSGSIVNYNILSNGAADLIKINSGFSSNDAFLNILPYPTGPTMVGTYDVVRLPAGLDPIEPLNYFTVADPAQGYGYNFSIAGEFITLTISGEPPMSTWNAPGGGSWGAPGNWIGGVPNSFNAMANLGSAIQAPSTVTLDGTRTIARLQFNNSVGGSSASYTIAPGTGGNLYFEETGFITDFTGSQAITAPILLGDGLYADVFSSNTTLSVSGGVSGSGGLNISGSGVLLLAGTNTFAGGEFLNGGTLLLGSSSALPSTGSLSLNGNALVDLNGFSTSVGTLSGSGTIDNVSAGGTVTLNVSTSTYSNFAGILQNSSGSLALAETGTGTLMLYNANTYSGGTTIGGASTLYPINNNSLGSGTVTVESTDGLLLYGGVNIANPIVSATGATEFAEVAGTATTATLSGNISALPGDQLRIGNTNYASTLEITGAANAGSSVAVISQGNVIFAGDGSLTTTSTMDPLIIGHTLTNTTLDLTLQDNSSLTGVGITLGGIIDNDNLATTVNMIGDATMNTGTGALDINGGASANTVSLTLGGNSNIYASNITFTSTNAGASATIVLNGGTINANAGDPAGSQFLPNFSNSGLNATIEDSAGGGTINNNGFSITLAQSITSTGNDGTIVFTGSGTTALASPNFYAAATNVQSGTLLVETAMALPTDQPVNISSGSCPSPGNQLRRSPHLLSLHRPRRPLRHRQQHPLHRLRLRLRPNRLHPRLSPKRFCNRMDRQRNHFFQCSVFHEQSPALRRRLGRRKRRNPCRLRPPKRPNRAQIYPPRRRQS